MLTANPKYIRSVIVDADTNIWLNLHFKCRINHMEYFQVARKRRKMDNNNSTTLNGKVDVKPSKSEMEAQLKGICVHKLRIPPFSKIFNKKQLQKLMWHYNLFRMLNGS